MKAKSIIIFILCIIANALSFAQQGVVYEYDGQHRLLQTTYPNGAVVNYTYDAVGNRTSMVVTGNQPTQFTITANASPTNCGTVSGGGQYNAGATCTLTAAPASGYQFDSWKKNGTVVSTDATYSFTVTENATYTAYFQQSAPTQYAITVNANNNAWGTVSGGGQYNAGSTCTLTAVQVSGYQFDNWKKNGTVVSTDATYSFTVTENATYTAYFSEIPITYYTITTNVMPAGSGTVSGGGQYNAGATCTLTAMPSNGYQFDSWKKNGIVVSTDATYSFTVTENATYTAYFSETPTIYYTITTDVIPVGSGTVSGGGTYPEGSSVTLQAAANDGYQFSQWNDGSTQNPRTITVTGDANYTATFTQLQYTISVYANPTSGGNVYGGGVYHYGEMVTIGATPNSGYEFAGWSDGNTQNPRAITVTANASYTAVFVEVGSTYYTVTANVSPSNAGVVNGTGVYEAGSTIVLSAEANPGYTFDRWSDGVTQNPRTITVNGNMDFTAYFSQNQYVVTVMAMPSNAGTVSGGGAYYYGEMAMLSATAYSGYEFQGWSDGSTENPHPVLVTGNATYTATFSQMGTTYYSVSAYVSPYDAGYVTGTGTFPEGGTTMLSAYAYNGYTFDHWNDGSTQNPRTVTVNNNMSFTAYFNTQEYTITTNVTPAGSGMVTGGGIYTYGTTATLTATPNYGFEFMQWSDGSLQNPRIVTVTGNAAYIALFSDGNGSMYALKVTSNYPLLGQVYGGGTYPVGAVVEISAFPSPYARFVQWNDGVTENPRVVVVEKEMSYEAEFVAARSYTIVVESAMSYMGATYGGGTFKEGSEIEISAVANPGYFFTGWQDGNMQNPRTIVVTGDANYMATFAENVVVGTHILTVTSNPIEGTVSGGGIYYHGVTAMLVATANPGYNFLQWSDGNTDNPRYVEVNCDMSFEAFFRGSGVDENDVQRIELYPNPAHTCIHIVGAEVDSELQIIDCVGKTVKIMKLTRPDEEFYIGDLPVGLYLARCGNNALRFVKQ